MINLAHFFLNITKKIRINLKNKRVSKETRSLILILLLAVVLRFFKLADLFNWLLDEEFWAYLPFNIATAYHFPLIGGHISGTGLYSGPLFVWLMAIPFWLFGGSPLGIAAMMSTLGVVTTAVTFWVGKSIFNKRVGLLAALLSASSFLMTIYDRKYWNASPLPLFSLLTILSLFNISKGKLKWTYVLAIVMALAFHAHMTSGALILFVVLSWIILKLPLNKRKVKTSILLFLGLQLPLLAFEFRHNFTNIRALTSFFQSRINSTPFFQALFDVANLALNTAGRLIYMPKGVDIAQELTLCTQYALTRSMPPFWAIGIALVSLLFILKNRQKTNSKLLLILLSVNFFGVFWYRLRSGSNWYPGQLSEYFFFPSFSIIFLGIASLTDYLLQRKKKLRLLVLIVIGAIILVNIFATFSAKHTDSYKKKQMIVDQAINRIGSESFYLDVKGDDPCLIYGYRYLFTIAEKEPTASYLDPQFLWLYEDRLPRVSATKSVTISVQSGTIDLEIENVPQSD